MLAPILPLGRPLTAGDLSDPDYHHLNHDRLEANVPPPQESLDRAPIGPTSESSHDSTSNDVTRASTSDGFIDQQKQKQEDDDDEQQQEEAERRDFLTEEKYRPTFDRKGSKRAGLDRQASHRTDVTTTTQDEESDGDDESEDENAKDVWYSRRLKVRRPRRRKLGSLAVAAISLDYISSCGAGGG